MSEVNYRIDVDTGGTFTDGVLTRADGAVVAEKVLTTPTDLSVGVLRLFEEFAKRESISLDTLLRHTRSVRYCTTQATNLLIERKGPKLGMITTRGFEDTLGIMRAVGRVDGLSELDAKHLVRARRPIALIPRNLIVGVTERVDCKGQVVISLNEDEVKLRAEELLQKGVEGIVVCLLWGFAGPHERQIEEIIRRKLPQYSEVPVTLASDVTPKFRELPRMNTTVINAYLKPAIERSITDLETKLRRHGYRGPLFLMQNFGGVASVKNTRPLDTWNSGPVAGILGGLFFGRLYGLNNVALADIGGTSFDISLISNGQYQVNTEPLVERFRCQGFLIEVKSIGAGGGSIAWINEQTGRVEVGPHSAGSDPGPAAYGFGGREPTVTDADLLLGVINPAYYHGGRMQLSLELARKAIVEKIAQPLAIDEIEAAAMITKTLAGKMRNLIFKEISAQGYDPREFAIFAIGGLGPTHCTDFAEDLNISKIYTFPYSAVFSALGASVSDIVHQYWLSKRINQVMDSSEQANDDPALRAAFNSTFQALEQRALRDAEAEGLDPAQVIFEHHLEMKYGNQLSEILIQSPVTRLNDKNQVRRLCDAFVEAYEQAYGQVASYKEGGIDIETFLLRASAEVSKPTFQSHARSALSPSVKAHRSVFFTDQGRWIETPIYQREGLEAGHVVTGPAIIESISTTYKVPAGWTFTIDELLNGIYERVA